VGTSVGEGDSEVDMASVVSVALEGKPPGVSTVVAVGNGIRSPETVVIERALVARTGTVLSGVGV